MTGCLVFSPIRRFNTICRYVIRGNSSSAYGLANVSRALLESDLTHLFLSQSHGHGIIIIIVIIIELQVTCIHTSCGGTS